MKKMKRVVAMLLAVVMVFGLAACGSKKSGDDSGKEEKSNYPEKQITLICPLAAGGGSGYDQQIVCSSYGERIRCISCC